MANPLSHAPSAVRRENPETLSQAIEQALWDSTDGDQPCGCSDCQIKVLSITLAVTTFLIKKHGPGGERGSTQVTAH